PVRAAFSTTSFPSHPAPTDLYPLSLHDALPISSAGRVVRPPLPSSVTPPPRYGHRRPRTNDALIFWLVLAGALLAANLLSDPLVDRKSTRLNSSHGSISYAVFCLKQKCTSTTQT